MWTGMILGRREFEVSTCSVKNTQQNKPSEWTCYEEGYHFWQRLWTAVFIPNPIGVVISLMLLFQLRELEGKCKIVSRLILLFSFLINTLVSTMTAGLLGF